MTVYCSSLQYYDRKKNRGLAENKTESIVDLKVEFDH